jgi:hypothetical protein
MIDDDFFEEKGVTGFGTPKFKLRKDLLNSLRAGPLPSDGDLTFAIVLTRLVRSELEAFGTGGGERLSDPEFELAQRTLRAVLHLDRDRPLPALAQLHGLQVVLVAERRLRVLAGAAGPDR